MIAPQIKTEAHKKMLLYGEVMKDTPYAALSGDEAFARDRIRRIEGDVDTFANQLNTEGVGQMGSSFRDLQRKYDTNKKAIDAVNQRYMSAQKQIEEIKEFGKDDPATWVNQSIAQYGQQVAQSQIEYNDETGEYNRVPTYGYVNYVDFEQNMMDIASEVAEEQIPINSVSDPAQILNGRAIQVTTANGEVKYVSEEEVLKVVMGRLQNPEMVGFLQRYQEFNPNMNIGLDPNDYFVKDGKIDTNTYVGRVIDATVDAKAYQKRSMNIGVQTIKMGDGHLSFAGGNVFTGPKTPEDATSLNVLMEGHRAAAALDGRVQEEETKLNAHANDLRQRGFGSFLSQYNALPSTQRGQYVNNMIAKNPTDPAARAMQQYHEAASNFADLKYQAQAARDNSDAFMRQMLGNNAGAAQKLREDVMDFRTGNFDAEVMARNDMFNKLKNDGKFTGSEAQFKSRWDAMIEEMSWLMFRQDTLNEEQKSTTKAGVGVTKKQMQGYMAGIIARNFGITEGEARDMVSYRPVFEMFSGDSEAQSYFDTLAGRLENNAETAWRMIPEQNRTYLTDPVAIQPYVSYITDDKTRDALEYYTTPIEKSIQVKGLGGALMKNGMTVENYLNQLADQNNASYAQIVKTDFLGIEHANAQNPSGATVMEASIQYYDKDGKKMHAEDMQIPIKSDWSTYGEAYKTIMSNMIEGQIMMTDPGMQNATTNQQLLGTYASMGGFNFLDVQGFLDNIKGGEQYVGTLNTADGSVLDYKLVGISPNYGQAKGRAHLFIGNKDAGVIHSDVNSVSEALGGYLYFYDSGNTAMSNEERNNRLQKLRLQWPK